MSSIPESDDIVAVAVRALDAFGGRLTRAAAGALLEMWRYRSDLSQSDMLAVLNRFPVGAGRRQSEPGA